MKLKIINNELLSSYLLKVSTELKKAFDDLKDAELSTANFSFYTSVASAFSSKIEGEDIEIDSYIKHKRDGIAFQADYTKKTDDLYNAYLYAQQNPLNEHNVKEIHWLLSQHLVTAEWQGKYRKSNIYVATDDGRIEYVAALPVQIPQEMEQFFEDAKILLSSKLSIEEVFFYAATIHLLFVKIHPWNDGNGRTARLLEKWFLAEKLGDKAWFVQSEKMYYQQHQTYYKNIRELGIEYEDLDYAKPLPFLLMLPNSVLT